jgi:multidrug efflux system membrane fusion protein
MQQVDTQSEAQKLATQPPAKSAGGNPASPPAPGKSEGRMWIVVLLLVALVIGGAVWKAKRARAASAVATARRGDSIVPITPGTVVKTNVLIYLDGLGTVQAFNTVTVTPRVDGQLIKVAFTEGQDVRTNDLLAQIDPGPFQAALEQAKARRSQDEALLENAKIDLDRDLQLTNIVTQQALVTQQAVVRQYDAAVKADQAGIDSAQVQLNYTTITAPIEGRCGLRMVDQGNIVRASDTNGLVVITQLRPISVVFTLPEQKVEVVSRKMAEGPVSVLALGRDNKTVLDRGTLAVIDNQIDTSTGTIRLKANFPNQDLRLWPGQFVNPRVLVDQTNGLVVQDNVIQRGPDGEYVFTIVGDGANLTAKLTPVKVAQMQDDLALIASGLTEGQKVVADGQYRLEDGSKIRIEQTNQLSGSTGASSRGERRGAGGGTNQPPANPPPKETGV